MLVVLAFSFSLNTFKEYIKGLCQVLVSGISNKYLKKKCIATSDIYWMSPGWGSGSGRIRCFLACRIRIRIRPVTKYIFPSLIKYEPNSSYDSCLTKHFRSTKLTKDFRSIKQLIGGRLLQSSSLAGGCYYSRTAFYYWPLPELNALNKFYHVLIIILLINAQLTFCCSSVQCSYLCSTFICSVLSIYVMQTNL